MRDSDTPPPSRHDFDPTLLREYDLRGIYGKTLREVDAFHVGKALATMIAGSGKRTIFLGRDGRLSSEALEAAAAEGIRAGGADVVRIGLGPTPMLYYAVFSRDGSGGIMVTGSHNPPEYNGFKVLAGNQTLHGDGIQQLGRIAKEGKPSTRSGSEGREDLMIEYIERVARDYGGGKLKVAWDAGNGAAGEAMVELTRRLPGEHILINERIDGTFPSHHPDPTEEKNLLQLRDVVLKEKCDLGIAFDGDGDRIGAIDGKGRIVWGDQMLALLARGVLERRPGATIISEVKASQVLYDEIARLGGKPLMWKTGHSLIKAKMAETGSPLAGEMSGHIFCGDIYYGFDDALYAAVRLLDVVSKSGKSLTQLRDSLPSVINTPELRFQCDDDRKFKVVEEVKERLKSAKGEEVSDIDGVRVKSKDGWWLLRASNTQDVLVARCEAPDEAALSRLKERLVGELKKSGVEPPTDL
jgi:phosphomannomutase